MYVIKVQDSVAYAKYTISRDKKNDETEVDAETFSAIGVPCKIEIKENGKVVVVGPVDPPCIIDGETTGPDLSALKSTRITQTKAALEAYLESHPLQWTDGKHYSVTAEKQALLNNALAVYQIGVQAGQAPELTWNATTEECTEWEFEGLCALALAIAAYVKPLVAHQQALEVMIRAAQTAEEVESIVIDYAAAG